MPSFFGKNNDFKIIRNISDQGLEFTVKFGSGTQSEPLSFPIRYSQYISLRELAQKDYFLCLQALEELWAANYLAEKGDGSYLLPKDKIYEVDKDLLDLIGVKDGKDLKIKLSSHMMVGSKNFKIKYDIYHPEWGYLSRFATIKNPLVSIDEDHLFLLDKDSAALISTLEAGVPSDKEQIRYVARVQELANNCGAELDSYLKNEKYYFPKNIDINLSSATPDEIELQPVLTDLPEELKSDEETIATAGYGSKATADGKWHRVIVEKPVQEKYRFIRERGRLRGHDVPRFLDNPLLYSELLPEDFDLEKFSDRVKGLKARIYKAAPFVRTKKSKYNWFDDIEVVGVVRNAFDDEDEFELTGQEYIDLIEKARESGTEYVRLNDKWIKVPENSENFISAYNRFKKAQETNVQVGKGIASYVFDIFENVDKLEYCLELLQEKSNLEQLRSDWEKGLLKLKGKLHPYQRDGYRWLTHLNYCQLGGLLADDMGLGKTVQVIALLVFMAEKGILKPSLIIAPKSLLDNWQSEIHKFSDIRDIYIHRGMYRIASPEQLKEYSIVLTTYETLVRDQLIFGEIDWQLIVCDEAQRIKNHTTYSSHAVRALKAKMRVALTGTPIENRLGDLWSIMDYAQPGYLGSYKYFRNKFETPLEKSFQESSEDMEARVKEVETKLMQKIKPIYLRREKEDVLKGQLPGKHIHHREIELSQVQTQLYKEELYAFKSLQEKSPLSTLNRLILLCSHPLLISESREEIYREIYKKPLSQLIEEGPKLQTMIEILSQIKKAGEKAIIFTRFRNMQYIIKRVITEYFRLEYCPIINGDTSFRKEIVDIFNSRSGFSCMILSPLAAGVGLNITGANHVIHFTRWWNPAVENQATDRVHRLGQEKEVHIYYPIMVSSEISTTVEEELARLIDDKRYLSKSIIVPNKLVDEQIYNELTNMLNREAEKLASA